MKKLNNGLEKGLRVIVMILVAASVIDVSLQIIFRYFIHHPIDWTEQLARYFFLFMCMLGLPVAYRNKGLIAFDLLLVRLPHIVQKWIIFLANVLIGAYSGFYLYQSITLFMKAGKKMASGTIHIPVKVTSSAQIICAVFLFWFALELIVDSFAELKNGEKEVTA